MKLLVETGVGRKNMWKAWRGGGGEWRCSVHWGSRTADSHAVADMTHKKRRGQGMCSSRRIASCIFANVSETTFRIAPHFQCSERLAAAEAGAGSAAGVGGEKKEVAGRRDIGTSVQNAVRGINQISVQNVWWDGAALPQHQRNVPPVPVADVYKQTVV